jgi:uncharacterized protein (DUF302 family)
MKRKHLISGIAGVLIGVCLTAVIMLSVMPSMMLKTYETKLGYDETIAALQDRIIEAGWVVSGVKEMNQSLAKEGVDFKPRVSLVSLCQPHYAKSILATDRHISVMMPCKFSVWEGDDGKVYLTKMNTGLMGKLFGGNVAKVMGGSVTADEDAILDGLLKH